MSGKAARVAAIAVFLAGAALHAPAGAAPVERLIPRDVYLETSMSPRTLTHYYAPRGSARSPSGRADAVSGDAGVSMEDRAPVLLFSGAWGWRPLMQDTASHLAARGRHVLGIDAAAYFKRLATQDEVASDIRILVAALNERAGRAAGAPVLMSGFDLGADNLPYLLNRAGAEPALGLLLLAPRKEGAAVFRVAVRLDLPIPDEETIDVAAEIARLPPLPLVIMQGENDDQGAARDLMPHAREPRLFVPIPGAGHNFREARGLYFRQLDEAIAWIERAAARPPGPESGPGDGDPSESAPSGDR